MRSSGSTPNPRSESPIPLLLVLVGEDHPRACTGRRLVATGSVQLVSSARAPPGHPLLLDPYADHPLVPGDRAIAAVHGLLGIDCSWNRLGSRGRYPPEVRWLGTRTERRRLPWLVAANPQHFGRLAELNTAEAFAAALYVLGERDRARQLLDGFAGGPAFFEVNARAIERYARAGSERELLEAERGTFAPAPAARATVRGR